MTTEGHAVVPRSLCYLKHHKPCVKRRLAKTHNESKITTTWDYPKASNCKGVFCFSSQNYYCGCWTINGLEMIIGTIAGKFNFVSLGSSFLYVPWPDQPSTCCRNMWSILWLVTKPYLDYIFFVLFLELTLKLLGR